MIEAEIIDRAIGQEVYAKDREIYAERYIFPLTRQIFFKTQFSDIREAPNHAS